MTDPPRLGYTGDGAERQPHGLIHDTLLEMPNRNETHLIKVVHRSADQYKVSHLANHEIAQIVDAFRRPFLYNGGGGFFRSMRGQEDEKKPALLRDDACFAVY